ncbi:MAG: hypothetical protein JWM74_714 [Myxococcaceae bacterium]|nr:hypothetical protein [Myxococcaceae bacterium]
MRFPLLFLLGVAACGGGKTPPATVPPTDGVDAGGSPVGSELGPPPGDTDLATASSDAGAAPTPATSGTVASQFSDTKAAPDQEDCSKSAIPYEEKVRPMFNACYQEGKKKNKDLQGVIKITIAVNTLGKVTSQKPDPSELGDSVVSCMVAAVKKTPFDGSACKGKTVVVGKTFGKPGSN